MIKNSLKNFIGKEEEKRSQIKPIVFVPKELAEEINKNMNKNVNKNWNKQGKKD